MQEMILDRKEGEEIKIPRCERKRCNGIVKPDIVFFGEGLPARFIEHCREAGDADLLLIMGTSLTVHPFASLAQMADRRTCQRVLINLERVGDLGKRSSDTVFLGDCDAVIRELCEELGWSEELDKAWAETKDSVRREGDSDKGTGKDQIVESKEEKKKDLEQEMEKITEALEKKLDLQTEAADAHKDSPSDHEGKQQSSGPNASAIAPAKKETKSEVGTGRLLEEGERKL